MYMKNVMYKIIMGCYIVAALVLEIGRAHV